MQNNFVSIYVDLPGSEFEEANFDSNSIASDVCNAIRDLYELTGGAIQYKNGVNKWITVVGALATTPEDAELHFVKGTPREQQTNQASLLQQQHSIPLSQEDEATFLQQSLLSSSTSSTIGIYESSSKRKRNSNSSVEDENNVIEPERKILRKSKTVSNFFNPIQIRTGRPTIKEAFGKETLFSCKGRDSQLNEILRYLTAPVADRSKSPAYFFHASPGVGKTFLLCQLYEKNFPQNYQHLTDEFFFLVADFNGDCCLDAESFQEKILKNPKLFVLLRIYYIEFIDQEKMKWKRFFKLFFEFANTVTLMDDAEDFMIEKLKDKSAGKKIILLVDEIMKTNLIKDDFPEICRSHICSFMSKFVDKVVFSSLNVKLMQDEILSGSNRSIIPICTLPALSNEDTIKLLQENIHQNAFNDPESNNTQNNSELYNHCIHKLAIISGGHGRSIENLVIECKTQPRKTLEDIIKNAAASLYSYLLSDELLQAVLLGKEVDKTAQIRGETYESLVSKGVLIDSFKYNEETFIPKCPELFLYSYAYQNKTKVACHLQDIFNMRTNFHNTNFESIHSIWERMIRHVRPEEEFRFISLHKVYKIIPKNNNYIQNDNSSILSCPVDAKSLLETMNYSTGTISVQLNTIIKPEDPNNAGWDRLIFYECFPTKDRVESNNKYVLPVFIQNKFSRPKASTKLSLGTVNKAVINCKRFLKKKCKFSDDLSLIPKKNENQSDEFLFGDLNYRFVLIFVARQDFFCNAVSDAPTNVMFCFENELLQLYGPTLGGFVKELVIDEIIVVNPVLTTTLQTNEEMKGEIKRNKKRKK